MQRLPQEELRQAYSLLAHEDGVGNQAVLRPKTISTKQDHKIEYDELAT